MASASSSSTTARATCTRRTRRSSGRRARAAPTPRSSSARAPADVAAADRIVLPGVGAFADCRRGLDAVPGMVEALETAVRRKGRPFLGICVGMQLMATRGLEFGETTGLGWIAGDVARSSRPTRRSRSRTWAGTRSTCCAPHPLLDGHRRRAPTGCTPISCTPSIWSARDRGDARRRDRLRRPGDGDGRDATTSPARSSTPRRASASASG